MSSIEDRLTALKEHLLTALEKHLGLTERSDKPAIQSHQVPEGWFLVNSDDIPSGHTHEWEIWDPVEPEIAWDSDSHSKPPWSYLIVARPKGGAS